MHFYLEGKKFEKMFKNRIDFFFNFSARLKSYSSAFVCENISEMSIICLKCLQEYSLQEMKFLLFFYNFLPKND